METFIILLTFTLLFFLSKKNFHVQKIPFNEAPKELQDAWLRRHPAKAWKMNLVNAFMRYVGDYNEKTTWWSQNANKVQYLSDAEMFAKIVKISKHVVNDCNQKLSKMSDFNIWFCLKVLRIRPDELVRLKFGNSIETLYWCIYLLDEGKKLLENPKFPTDADILMAWRRGKLLKFKPIFTKDFIEIADEYAHNIVFAKK